MAEFLTEYGLFLLKAVTIVAAVVAILAALAAASRRATTHEGLEVESLNRKYRRLAAHLRRVMLGKAEWKAVARAEKASEKVAARSRGQRPRGFVVDFKGDLKASAVASLREEISAILEVARDDDLVVVRLENFGGVVHEHGLGASQLARIRDRGLQLVACVDKVAASGGYLMACVANRIVAAPFAILGSIGVIAQLPNFNRMLEGHGIDWEMVTAGEYKRNVTMFGKNTDADRARLKAAARGRARAVQVGRCDVPPGTGPGEGEHRRALVRRPRPRARPRGRAQDQRPAAGRARPRARPVPGQLQGAPAAAPADARVRRRRAGAVRGRGLAPALRIPPPALSLAGPADPGPASPKALALQGARPSLGGRQRAEAGPCTPGPRAEPARVTFGLKRWARKHWSGTGGGFARWCPAL
jgi:serine protease SohB